VTDHTEDERRREAAREDRRRELAKMTKTRLCRMYRNGITTPRGTITQWIGGMHPPEQWRKDEVISSILRIEYPPPDAEPDGPRVCCPGCGTPDTAAGQLCADCAEVTP
jgi:hypothetical protein